MSESEDTTDSAESSDMDMSSSESSSSEGDFESHEKIQDFDNVVQWNPLKWNSLKRKTRLSEKIHKSPCILTYKLPRLTETRLSEKPG